MSDRLNLYGCIAFEAFSLRHGLIWWQAKTGFFHHGRLYGRPRQCFRRRCERDHSHSRYPFNISSQFGIHSPYSQLECGFPERILSCMSLDNTIINSHLIGVIFKRLIDDIFFKILGFSILTLAYGISSIHYLINCCVCYLALKWFVLEWQFRFGSNHLEIKLLYSS